VDADVEEPALAGAADDALCSGESKNAGKIVRMSIRIRDYGRRPSSSLTLTRRPSRSIWRWRRA